MSDATERPGIWLFGRYLTVWLAACIIRLPLLRSDFEAILPRKNRRYLFDLTLAKESVFRKNARGNLLIGRQGAINL
jgi:hypothetical protein